MVMLLTLHHMGFIFVNLSDVLEHLVMLQTSTLIKSKLNGRFKSLLRQGLSEPDFCSDLVIN